MGTSTVLHKNSVFLFELSGANSALLNDPALCAKLLKQLTVSAGLQELKSLSHSFSPQGVSIISLLAESHIALHTWPELGTGYITLTTCKEPADGFESEATALLEASFKSETVKTSRL